MKTLQYIMLLSLLTFMLKAEEEWHMLSETGFYLDLRKFLFENKKQLSNKYIPFNTVSYKNLSTYSRKIISQFQKLPYVQDDNASTIKIKNYFGTSKFYLKVNGYLIKKDNSLWYINKKEHLLWVFDALDTKAELATFLWVYDSYKIHCKYSYQKTSDGYRVKKVVFGYPEEDYEKKKSFVHEKVYILDINKNGSYTSSFMEERRKYFSHIIIPPTPLWHEEATEESILNNGTFITPMNRFYFF